MFIAACRSVIIACLFSLCLFPANVHSYDEGTFRGNWWNYYDRGLATGENPGKEFLEKALADLKQSAAMRSKDQRMARTYGMHFIEYFPHREIGIIYYKMGRIDMAVRELEESLRMEESAKANFYLNKARKRVLETGQKRVDPPTLSLESDKGNIFIKERFYKLKGRTAGKGLVSRILINREPYRFDTAQEELVFEKEVKLQDGKNTIVVSVEDLIGNRTEKGLTVNVKREGPTININNFVISGNKGQEVVEVTGEVADEVGISNIVINGREQKTDALKSFPLSFSIPVKWDEKDTARLVNGVVILQASDTLRNTTTAEVSIPQALVRVMTAQKTAELAGLKKIAEEQEKVKRLALEREAAEKAERERIERGRLEAEKKAAERLAFEKAELERIARDKVEAEKRAAEKLAFEKAEAARRAKEERERVQREEAEQRRIALEHDAIKRAAMEKAERERIEQEKVEAEKRAAEKLALEKAETERRAKEEKERIEREEAEKRRIAVEREAAERLAAEKAERERIEREKVEAEKKAAEKLAFEEAEKKRLASAKKKKEAVPGKKKTDEERLTGALGSPSTEKGVVVEREKLGQILEEQKLSDALGDESRQIKLGNMEGGKGTKPYTDTANLPPISKGTPTVETNAKPASCVSPDKENPILTLKDTAGLPQVFVDRYPVEGEAFDNCGIEKVVINGREIPFRKGPRLYFSKMVDLAAGENKIGVEIYDATGNKAAASYSVTRVVPSVLQEGSRMSLLVLPFDIKPGTTSSAPVAEDYLAGAFVEQNRFNLVERKKIREVIEAQKFGQAVLSDPEQFIKLGKLMVAESILATTIRENGDSIEIVSRVINTETSEIMTVKDVYGEDKSPSSVHELMEGLASKIAGSFPLVEGIVVKRDSRSVMTDLGKALKIRKKMGAIVYRKGEEIKHPRTGRSLGWETIKLGEGYIEDIQEDFSKIRLLEKGLVPDITVNDMVITK